MYGQVFLHYEENSCRKIQCREFLEEEGAGHDPPEVSCGSFHRSHGTGQFLEPRLGCHPSETWGNRGAEEISFTLDQPCAGPAQLLSPTQAGFCISCSTLGHNGSSAYAPTVGRDILGGKWGTCDLLQADPKQLRYQLWVLFMCPVRDGLGVSRCEIDMGHCGALGTLLLAW